MIYIYSSPLKPLSVNSVLRALSSRRGLRGAPEAPPLCRETQSLGQHMLGKNGLKKTQRWACLPIRVIASQKYSQMDAIFFC